MLLWVFFSLLECIFKNILDFYIALYSTYIFVQLNMLHILFLPPIFPTTLLGLGLENMIGLQLSKITQPISMPMEGLELWPSGLKSSTLITIPNCSICVFVCVVCLYTYIQNIHMCVFLWYYIKIFEQLKKWTVYATVNLLQLSPVWRNRGKSILAC